MVATIIAASSANPGLLVDFLLSLGTSGGLLGILIAFVRLPREKTSAAVTQAQGANEALAEALEAVERERDYWRRRFEACHARANELAAEQLRRGGASP